jgi:hypothetical protein
LKTKIKEKRLRCDSNLLRVTENPESNFIGIRWWKKVTLKIVEIISTKFVRSISRLVYTNSSMNVENERGAYRRIRTLIMTEEFANE